MRHALTLSLATAALLLSATAHAAEQARSVAPFTSVSNAGPVNLYIEVGKAQSITVSGGDDYLAQLVTEVVDGELRIRLRNDTHFDDRHWDDMKITVAVPQLTAFTMAGAGQTTITHMRGDKLDLRFGGAGSLKAEGTVRDLQLNVGGVGAIDTRDLHAATVNANIGGVGSVRVWASERLEASVGGVGSLTYYGDPRIVHTSGGGLGSIAKGR